LISITESAKSGDLEPKVGDILETFFQLDGRKFKSKYEIDLVRGGDSRRTLVRRKLLYLKKIWLGGRDSNPDTVVQRRRRKKR